MRADAFNLSRTISIHAPREGSDVSIQARISRFTQFQSTPPARGATFDFDFGIEDEEISIHAPREGSDAVILPERC